MCGVRQISRYKLGGMGCAGSCNKCSHGVSGLGEDNECFRRPAPAYCFSASGVAETTARGIAQQAEYENARQQSYYENALESWRLNGGKGEPPPAPALQSTDYRAIMDFMNSPSSDYNTVLGADGKVYSVDQYLPGSHAPVVFSDGINQLPNAPASITPKPAGTGTGGSVASTANQIGFSIQSTAESIASKTGLPIWALAAMGVIGVMVVGGRK